MNLFRLKKKRQYIREQPSAFTPTLKDIIMEKAKNAKEEKIAA